MARRKTKSKSKPVPKWVLAVAGVAAIGYGATALPPGEHYAADAAQEPKVEVISAKSGGKLSLGAQRAQQAYQAGWPKARLADVVAIGYAETDPRWPLSNNSHLHNTDGSDDNCWLQVNSKNKRLFRGDSPSDPVGCARIAKRIHAEQGFRAWTTVKTGKYLKFRPQAVKDVAEAGLS